MRREGKCWFDLILGPGRAGGQAGQGTSRRALLELVRSGGGSSSGRERRTGQADRRGLADRHTVTPSHEGPVSWLAQRQVRVQSLKDPTSQRTLREYARQSSEGLGPRTMHFH